MPCSPSINSERCSDPGSRPAGDRAAQGRPRKPGHRAHRPRPLRTAAHRPPRAIRRRRHAAWCLRQCGPRRRCAGRRRRCRSGWTDPRTGIRRRSCTRTCLREIIPSRTSLTASSTLPSSRSRCPRGRPGAWADDRRTPTPAPVLASDAAAVSIRQQTKRARHPFRRTLPGYIGSPAAVTKPFRVGLPVPRWLPTFGRKGHASEQFGQLGRRRRSRCRRRARNVELCAHCPGQHQLLKMLRLPAGRPNVTRKTSMSDEPIRGRNHRSRSDHGGATDRDRVSRPGQSLRQAVRWAGAGLMDKAAFVVGSRFTRSRMVTASSERVELPRAGEPRGAGRAGSARCQHRSDLGGDRCRALRRRSVDGREAPRHARPLRDGRGQCRGPTNSGAAASAWQATA